MHGVLPYEIRIVAHPGKAHLEVSGLVEDEVDPSHLCITFAREAMLTGDVTQDRRRLTQLDLA